MSEAVEQHGGGPGRAATEAPSAPTAEAKKVLVKLDRHEAWKTCARTWWTLKDGMPLSSVGRRILVDFDDRRSHWHEYWIVPEDVVLVKHRITNRGLYRKIEVEPWMVVASSDEIPVEVDLNDAGSG